MTWYISVLILSGLAICFCMNIFGRLALGTSAALNANEKIQKRVANLFRVGILIFGLFCIFVGIFALFTGIKLI
jgi:hypothetical protein